MAADERQAPGSGHKRSLSVRGTPAPLTHLKAGRLAGRASWARLWPGPGDRWGTVVSGGLGLPEAEDRGISYASGPKLGCL